VRHHMLTNYMHAILLVVLAQFTGLGFLDGMEGVIKLAEASSYVQVYRFNIKTSMARAWVTIIFDWLDKHIVVCASGEH